MLNNIIKFIFIVWKIFIILMVIIGIGFGILGEGLMILVVLLIKCIIRVGVYICVKMLVIMFILCLCELIF